MDTSMISKVEKAKHYADEKHRIHITALSVTLDGENSEHHLAFHDHEWHCDCSFFHDRGWCSHTLAMEHVLAPMIPVTNIETLP